MRVGGIGFDWRPVAMAKQLEKREGEEMAGRHYPFTLLLQKTSSMARENVIVEYHFVFPFDLEIPALLHRD